MSSKKSNKKIFEIDLTRFEELQELLSQYFEIFSTLLDKENINIKSIILNADSEKVIVEGIEDEEDSEEDTEPDFEWI